MALRQASPHAPKDAVIQLPAHLEWKKETRRGVERSLSLMDAASPTRRRRTVERTANPKVTNPQWSVARVAIWANMEGAAQTGEGEGRWYARSAPATIVH